MRINSAWLFLTANSVRSKYQLGKAAISGRTKTTNDDVLGRGCSILPSLTGNCKAVQYLKGATEKTGTNILARPVRQDKG